ncbi:hypothetical protein [Methylomicrobium lacus]|uniref:hypothetical protein n=1 Tax=Methylomicrobium lacus TaxID=136992 RepID=UPI0035A93242
MRYAIFNKPVSAHERALLFSCFLLFSGCNANYHSIFRTTKGDGYKIAFTDAKQSATIIKMGKDGVMRACAAKSPDVFQALSTAFSGNLSAEETAGIAAKMAGAGSSAESAASFRLHTQLTDTQNELLYQLCVNSLNNTITGDQLATELHRYQNTMVTMLAIEQLTGYARPALVTLGGGKSTTGSAEDIAKIQSSLDAARTNEEKYKGSYEKASATLSEKQGVYDKAKAESESAPTDTTKKAALKKAEDDLTATMSERTKFEKLWKDATDNRKGIESARDQVLTDLSTNSGGATASFSQPSIISIGTDANTAEKITSAIKSLQDMHLHQTFTTDECLSFLFHPTNKSLQNDYLITKLNDFCFSHIQEVDKYKLLDLLITKGCAFSTNKEGNIEVKECKNPGNDIPNPPNYAPPNYYPG